MTQYNFQLDARYSPAEAPTFGKFNLTLTNISNRTIRPARLAWSALTRIPKGASISGATLLSRFGNFHEVALPGATELGPGESHLITVHSLSHAPKHRLDGPKSACLTLANGSTQRVLTGDLALDGPDSGELRIWPAGAVTQPLAMLPWPRELEITAWREDCPILVPAPDTNAKNLAALAHVSALSRRLFPERPIPFRLDGTGVPITFVHEIRAPDAYTLDFSPNGITLTSSTPSGRDYGLTALAQILHGCQTDGSRFSFPAEGRINDIPRFSWRGSHLDVSRHFWTREEVMRFLDILAWHRMNILQWHLTDDEGWRLEIPSLPQLTQTGAVRGPAHVLPGQHNDIWRSRGGYYSTADVRRIVSHAASLNIDVVPEIDVPGHATAALAALPHLRDPDETTDSYRSIQGYPNNALNPALPQTYAFLETVLTETAALFPSRWLHVGGDEVDHRSWLSSPRAIELMESEGLSGTMELQAHLMRRVQKMLRSLGKTLTGWDEVSEGGGIEPFDTLLVAWQKPAVIRRLIQAGYDVIASPGQAYYMDMVQASGWMEPGASWAGVSTPESCYAYLPDEGLTASEMPSLKGIQAGIWCEHIHDRALFNHMVFPRLSAVAETAWSPQSTKDWNRFAALARHMPQL